MSVSRSRVLDLLKVQCRIYGNVYNPEGLRTGNKVLRQRLRGPAIASYYPRKTVTFSDLQKAYPGYEMLNDDEEQRLEDVDAAKLRGKGAPKKKKTAAESKKYHAKKRQTTVSA